MMRRHARREEPLIFGSGFSTGAGGKPTKQALASELPTV
jgi:hypothetical protein